MDCKKLLTALSVITLTSCTHEEHLEGTREEFLPPDKIIQTDKSIAGEKVILPTAEVASEWLQQGYKINYILPHLDFKGSFESSIFTIDIGEGEETRGKKILHSPIVVGDTLYAIDTNGKVTSMNAKTGDINWQVNYLEPYEQRNSPVTAMSYSNNKLFLSLSQEFAMAINVKDGSVAWKKSLTDISRIAPVVYSGNVYYLCIDNNLQVFDAETGEKKWAHVSIQEEAGLLGGSNITVASGNLVIPFSSGELTVLSPSGALLWADQISSQHQNDLVGSIAHIYAPIVADGKRIIVSSHTGSMIAYNLTSGKRTWEQPILNLQQPAVAGDYMYVIDKSQRMICMRKDTGQIKWTQQLWTRLPNEPPELFRQNWHGPLLVSGKVMAFSNYGNISVIDPQTGKIEEEKKVYHTIATTPIIVNRVMYMLTEKNQVVAYK